MKIYDRLLCVFVRLAIRRGVLWQSNDPARHDDGIGWDKQRGWQPLFSVRHGKRPVYAFPGVNHMKPGRKQ